MNVLVHQIDQSFSISGNMRAPQYIFAAILNRLVEYRVQGSVHKTSRIMGCTELAFNVPVLDSVNGLVLGVPGQDEC